MQVDLTPNDIRILKEALESWERSSFFDSIARLMLTSGLDPANSGHAAKIREEVDRTMRRSEETASRRKDQAALVRAVLVRAEMLASEHP
jgi:hypothetical protein